MDSFQAFRVHRDENRKITSGFEHIRLDDLTDGEVVIRVAFSSINYKDALAATGAGQILRKYPLVSGIDLAGIVESSTSGDFTAGQEVVVCGGGLSETLDGGYAEYARVPADIVVPLPDGLTLRDSMAIGTAGFTAALAVTRMQDNGQVPERGPILVTGATGGVGSMAIDLLAGQGYDVHALTSKPQQEAYLTALGATAIVNANDLEYGKSPLEKAQWGGAVDSLGGDVLSWLTRTTEPWGNIVSIGLAAGPSCNTTVLPFILRGIALLGVTSANCLPALRKRAWQRLATDLKPRHIEQIVTRDIAFSELPDAFQGYLDGAVTGRTIVKIS